MANADNLKPNARRTPEQLREMGSKGGKKSAEARARARTTKAIIKEVLALTPTLKKTSRDALKKAGYDIEAQGLPTVETIIHIAIANQAMQGDLASARMLFDYAQVPDLKATLEKERIKAIKDGRAKLDVSLNTTEEASIMDEIERRLNQTPAPAATEAAATTAP